MDAPEKKLWNWRFAAAMCGGLALVLLKGAHWPNAWSMTHYLFSYENGFAKRALFGDLIRMLIGDRRFAYENLGQVAIGVFLVVFTAMIVMAWRRRDQFMVLFLFSPGASYFVYTIGYLDHVVYGLTFAGLWAMARLPRAAPWIAAAIGAVAILVHEGALLSSLPLLAVSLVLHQRRLAPTLAVFAALAGMSGAASLTFAFTPESLQTYRAGLETRADFGLHPVAFPVLIRSFADCFQEMLPYLESFGIKRIVGLTPWILLFEFWFLEAAWRTLASHPHRRVTFAVVVAAALAPLAMFFLAYDYDRWAALSILNAYVALAIVAPSREALRFTHPRPVFALLLLIGMFSSFAQFSGAPLRLPPAFEEPIDY